MATKELTKRLLKGLGICPNCKYGIKLEFFTKNKAFPPGPAWTVDRDVYNCLKQEGADEPSRDFCEIEWERLDNASKEYVIHSLNEKFAICFSFDRNLLDKRNFRKRVDDLREGAHDYLKWKEENDS